MANNVTIFIIILTVLVGFIIFMNLSTDPYSSQRQEGHPCMCPPECLCKKIHGPNGRCYCNMNMMTKMQNVCLCDHNCRCRKHCAMMDGSCPCSMKRRVGEKASIIRSMSTSSYLPNTVPIEVRAKQFMLAWKDTLSHPLLNTHDPNVLYSLWVANMARRGLAPLYSTPCLFEASFHAALGNQLTIPHTITIIENNYAEEVACEKKSKSVASFQKPVCLN